MVVLVQAVEPDPDHPARAALVASQAGQGQTLSRQEQSPKRMQPQARKGCLPESALHLMLLREQQRSRKGCLPVTVLTQTQPGRVFGQPGQGSVPFSSHLRLA